MTTEFKSNLDRIQNNIYKNNLTMSDPEETRAMKEVACRDNHNMKKEYNKAVGFRLYKV